jgi:hypothetical protein
LKKSDRLRGLVSLICIIGLLLVLGNLCCSAQSEDVAGAPQDTIRVMSYNVLHYGNGCQGPNAVMHRHLSEIIQYLHPDIAALVKVAAIKKSPLDKFGIAPIGFEDSILKFAMNRYDTDKYSIAPRIRNATANNECLLLYNTRKVGCVGPVSVYTDITDFVTYKMYVREKDLGSTRDTIFFYVTICHDKSGRENELIRKRQIKGVVKVMENHFTSLPNYIVLGDFNTSSSNEACYQTLTQPEDTGFRFFDPPFYPDQTLQYPADWKKNSKFGRFLTTSTRASDTFPNDCGTGGGAKDWYDHIFISSWLVRNTNRAMYIKGSYRTIGNDGNRIGVDINDKGQKYNSSAPQRIIDALFQFSNKYPVVADFAVYRKIATGGARNTEILGVPILSNNR